MLTVLRILLVAPYAWFLLQEQYQVALLLLFIAGVSDGLDGFLARQFGWYSRFGAIADPIADKILLVVSYLVLGVMEHVPLWLVYLVVGRDILIFSGAFTYWKLVGRFEAKPTWLGKTCTFLLIAYGLLVLINLALITVSQTLLDGGAWLVAVFCGLSGLHYVYLGIVKTRESRAG
ncbi:MAG: CDP-alcohol phosphatidyltransferase [Gammaproteobacteria bacterium]|nr:MAG: CDP-alcohol phosphatidyltransferase [Gammaproteobacteria bacterium]